MNAEEKRDASEPEEPNPSRREPEQAPTESPNLGPEEERTPISAALEEASAPAPQIQRRPRVLKLQINNRQ